LNAYVSILIKPAGLPVAAQRIAVRRGASVEELALAKYGSIDGIEAWVRAAPGDNRLWRAIPRERWRHVRPLADDAIQFSFRPQGGSSRNLFVTVAALALAVAAPFAGAAIATALGFTAAWVGTAIGVGIAVGGTLVLNKLFPAASESGSGSGDEARAFADVTSDGNLSAKGAFLPIVCGRRRIAPPDIIQPRIYVLDGIQTVDRCVALWGEHEIADVWVDGTPAASIAAITTDIKDGNEATGGYGFIDVITASSALQETLSTFALDDVEVEDQETPANSSPRWHAFSTAGNDALEEIVIRFRADGFVTQNSTTEKQRVPLRMRMRVKGESTWINLPEIHMVGREASVLLRDIRLRWGNDFGGGDVGNDISFEFWREVPAVTAHPLADGSENTIQWQAHSHFASGAGLRDTANIRWRKSGINVTLDESVFPKFVDYEFQIMRGLATVSTSLTSSYQISGVTYSLFVSRVSGPNWVVPVGQGGFLSQLSLVMATAIARRWPTEWPKTAKLELRSSGQSVRAITLEAGRAVMDWNGSDAWDVKLTNCVNPATQYRQVLVDWLESREMDLDLIDEDAFVAWRAECAARGYRCSAMFAGKSHKDALAVIAEAGFARPVYGERFSVDYFRDRSGETPVQLFGLRNTESITFDTVAPERPSGYRAGFDNRANDWVSDEIEVTLGGAADIEVFEAITYEGIDDIDLVRRRATFDLLQVDLRRRQWTISAGLEATLCLPGDLISLVTDLMDDSSQSVRIRDAIDATHLRIDQIIPSADAPPWDTNPSIADLFSIGESHLIFIQTPAGVLARTITGVSGNVLTLGEALPSTDGLAGKPAHLVPESNATHRVIVTSVSPQGEERAVITAVDECPEIYSELERLFG